MRTLKKWDIERRPNEGPLTLMEKVRNTKPALAGPLAPVLEGLIEARFGPRQFSREEFDALAKDVRKLRKLSPAR